MSKERRWHNFLVGWFIGSLIIASWCLARYAVHGTIITGW